MTATDLMRHIVIMCLLLLFHYMIVII